MAPTTANITAAVVNTDPKAGVTYTTQAVVDAMDAALAAAEAEPTTANLDAVLAAWAAAATTPGPVLF
jgi:hypothetical protein